MRPISLITAVILPLAFAAPVPEKDNSPQVIPIPPPAVIQALIDAGLGQFATPADIAYINNAIAAAEAAAAATQKAGGSSKRQDLGLGSITGALDPILGILGSLGLGGLKERDEIVKRQDLGLGALTSPLEPILGILGSLGIGGLKERDQTVKRQSLPVLGNVVGSVPGIATGTGITNDLPIVGPVVGGLLQNPTSVTSVLGGGLKEKAKRRQEVAAAMKE
ncbi:hypothetical protein BELL_1935g00010 [Botrytis elliptica]|uniref:Uncharacterized protein n=1 Tax=Botrytis elliptica TaxID=278938 RepID=A0A4Z1HIY7_9HELO|nr:hypothetical protein EAE99_002273 [Botrytis elliptica]TGO49006.1 hypothetical protein BELL_1935g00010 [Botrytis elliptica]